MTSGDRPAERDRLSSFDAPVRAFVQGGGGGLGTALVELLLESDKVERIWASSRTPQDASRRLGDPGDERLDWLRLDLEDEASIAEAVGTIAGSTDRLDLVVNASGLLHREGLEPEKRLSKVTAAGLHESFAVNAVGPLLVLRHCLPLLPRRQRSVVASLSARVGSIDDNRLGGWFGYRGSKAALNMLMRTAAIELARSHPACSCLLLHPGTVDTALSRPFQVRVPAEKLFRPRFAVERLLEVVDGVPEGESGRFLAWDGQPIPW